MDNPSEYDFWTAPDPEDDDLIDAYLAYLIGLVAGED
jgi:hypothetical protein